MGSTLRNIPPLYLLLAGWVLFTVAMVIRVTRGLELPWLNGLFILIGLGVYFLPSRFYEKGAYDRLMRRLLWLLVLAGFLILARETVGYLTGG